MPSVAFVHLTALMASAAVVNACKFCGAMNSSLGQNLWRGWQDFLGLLSIAMLPQVQPDCMFLTVMQHSWLAALMVRVNVYNDASIAKSLAIEWQLQAIWATCSKHHTMVPAYTASVVAVTYLVMVSADTS